MDSAAERMTSSATRNLTFHIQAPATTNLAWWAQQLGANQSARIDAGSSLANATGKAIPVPPRDVLAPWWASENPTTEILRRNSAMVINSNVGYYRPQSKELAVIARTFGSPYCWLTYKETANNGAGQWYQSLYPTLNLAGHTYAGDPNYPLDYRDPLRTIPGVNEQSASLPNYMADYNCPSTDNGHAFDHDAIDHTTGDVYFRRYGNNLRAYGHRSGAWFQTATQTGEPTVESTSTLKFCGAAGLVWADPRFVYRNANPAAGSTWTQVYDANLNPRFGNMEGAYNATAQVFIYGGGGITDQTNGLTLRQFTVNQLLNPGTLTTNGTAIPNPWDVLGSAHQISVATTGWAVSGSVFLSVPGSAHLLARFRASTATYRFGRYDINAQQWTGLAAGTLSNDPLKPYLYNGPPAYANEASDMGFEVPGYDVIVYIVLPVNTAGGDNQLWMYKP